MAKRADGKTTKWSARKPVRRRASRSVKRKETEKAQRSIEEAFHSIAYLDVRDDHGHPVPRLEFLTQEEISEAQDYADQVSLERRSEVTNAFSKLGRKLSLIMAPIAMWRLWDEDRQGVLIAVGGLLLAIGLSYLVSALIVMALARLLKTPISLERNVRYEIWYLELGDLLSIAGSVVVLFQLISSL